MKRSHETQRAGLTRPCLVPSGPRTGNLDLQPREGWRTIAAREESRNYSPSIRSRALVERNALDISGEARGRKGVGTEMRASTDGERVLLSARLRTLCLAEKIRYFLQERVLLLNYALTRRKRAYE